MSERRKKWKCGCGETFYTKKECKDHIHACHWDIINHSGGFAGMFYKPTKIEG